MNNIKKAAAAAVCIAVLSGCSGGAQAPADTTVSAGTTAAAETPALTTPRSAEPQSAAALASENEPDSSKEDKPLVIAVNGVSGSYSPFYGSGDCAELLDTITGVRLIGRTRNGAAVTRARMPQTELSGGKGYAYSGISDTAVSYDEDTDTTTYTFTLRDDVKFADGNTLDADDVIFTLYLHLDPSYNGTYPLYYANIVGALNYCFDSAIADTVTDEQIDEALASEGIALSLREKLILPALKEQYETVESMFGDSSYSFYTAQYPEPQQLFAYFYSLDSEYDAKGKSKDDVISDIADNYSGNYRLLAGMTTGDETAYDSQAVSIAVEYITEQQSDPDTPREHIVSVSGITKTGQYGVRVDVRGNGSTFENALSGMTIVPLHYYGDSALFDTDKNTFGFTKGKAYDVTGAHADAPLGAGAYRISGYENGELRLEANKHYYKGIPAAGSIKLIGGTPDEAAALIAGGEADICAANGSAENYDAVDEANRSIEKIMAAVSDNYGYGYIGLNAQTVNIDGDEFSDKSYALRKGLATAMAFFREDSVGAYFGSHAEIIDYPTIDRVEPAAGDTAAPYTLDADGKPIFTDEMSADERREAVKEACLGFFREAGCTVSEDGIVTEAPEGGRLTFRAEVVCSEDGSHPALPAMENAAALLSEIGITLNVERVSDPSVLWESIRNGVHEIWAGAWNDSLRSIYLEGYYGIASEKLTELVGKAESAAQEDKPAAYMECLDRAINVYAAEIPLYKRTACTLFSTLRVDVSTVPDGMTDTYGWADEIEKIKLK